MSNMIAPVTGESVPKPEPVSLKTVGRQQWGQRLRPWLYMAPALIALIGLLAYPVYQLILVSFFDYRQAQVSGGAPLNFVGLDNYFGLFKDPQFWTVLTNTVVFAVGCVLVTLTVGITLAVFATRVSTWARTVLFVVALGAWATPAITGSAVWLFLFDPTLGLVNKVLVGIGFESFAGHSWTFDKWSAFALIGSEVVWCSFPFVMITVYAGIMAISEDMLEAARMDGASAFTIFRSIMLPLLRPIIVIVTVQSIIWDFKVFTQVYVMTAGGGVAGQNQVLNVYGYQTAFAASKYGIGSAIGVIMTLLLIAVTMVYLRILKRSGEVL